MLLLLGPQEHCRQLLLLLLLALKQAISWVAYALA
jgi:hypothetical protein